MLINNNFASKWRWSTFALGPQMHQAAPAWLGNLPTSTELQGFHYFQGRIQYNMQLQYFLYIWNTTTDSTLKNPNYKRRFHNGLNEPKKFSSSLGLLAQASAPWTKPQ